MRTGVFVAVLVFAYVHLLHPFTQGFVTVLTGTFDACEARGGSLQYVPFSRPICIKRDAIIDLDR